MIKVVVGPVPRTVLLRDIPDGATFMGSTGVFSAHNVWEKLHGTEGGQVVVLRFSSDGTGIHRWKPTQEFTEYRVVEVTITAI